MVLPIGCTKPHTKGRPRFSVAVSWKPVCGRRDLLDGVCSELVHGCGDLSGGRYVCEMGGRDEKRSFYVEARSRRSEDKVQQIIDHVPDRTAHRQTGQGLIAP